MANCPASVSMPLVNAFYPKASTLAAATLRLLGKAEADLAAIDQKDYFKGPY